jgi:hypothetical protein
MENHANLKQQPHQQRHSSRQSITSDRRRVSRKNATEATKGPSQRADAPCEAAQAVRRSDQRHRPKDRRPKGRQSNHLNRWKTFGDARRRNRNSERKENSHQMYTGTRGSLIKPPAQQTIAAGGYTATRCKGVTKCIQEQVVHVAAGPARFKNRTGPEEGKAKTLLRTATPTPSLCPRSPRPRNITRVRRQRLIDVDAEHVADRGTPFWN